MQVVLGSRNGLSMDSGPSTEEVGWIGAMKRCLCAEEVQNDAQAQVDETRQGDDPGKSFGVVVGYQEHVILAWPWRLA